jgi:hypothetical protein
MPGVVRSATVTADVLASGNRVVFAGPGVL